MAQNLGTAWIQIKPSIKGISSSIKSELSGVGSTEGSNVGSKFSAGFAAKIGIISGITQQVFQKVTSIITNQLDDAIYRVDTLERFPKVMEMMGYSAEDAASAIKKLRDGVAGIPTSLADVVSGTQRIAALTGDVDQAADWALAISDAMIITTGDTNEAARGMEQFLQILSRGKPAGNDWNTVMEVAAPIMNELAKTMGYASASLGGDFYTALQKGTISTNDMMAALVSLDKKGGNGLASLSDRVKTSTGGIAASMTSLQQNISNAIVDVIQTIGVENITAAIETIKEALIGIVQAIGGIFTFIQENWAWLEPILTFLVSSLLPTIEILVGYRIFMGIKALAGVLNGMLVSPWFLGLSVVIGLLVLIATHFDDIKNVVGAVFNSMSQTIGNFASWIRGVFQGIWNNITGTFANIGAFFTGVWNTIVSIFTGIGTTVGNAVSGAFKTVVNGVLTFIENFINGPVNVLNGFIEIINNAFGGIGVHLEHISTIKLPRMARGGIVEGVGTGTSDSNLVALSKGEFVVRAAAAESIGYDRLEAMNDSGEIGGNVYNNITINGYNKDPEELAEIVSRKIALSTAGVF